MVTSRLQHNADQIGQLLSLLLPGVLTVAVSAIPCCRPTIKETRLLIGRAFAWMKAFMELSDRFADWHERGLAYRA